jgi:anti-sigma regulatory factor (Ser/Thr protein kinase)
MIARCKKCDTSFKVRDARVTESVESTNNADDRRVFISYSSCDRTAAETVRRTVESHGLRCWMAPESVAPGQDYGGAIVEGIRACSAFVLVFSKHSNASKQVLREVERASSLDKTVITFRIDESIPTQSMEYFLSSPHRLDANSGPLESHVARLAKVLRGLLTMPSAETGTSAGPTPVVYSPSLLPEWNRKLQGGGLAEVFDCNNEILMHDLRDLLRLTLEARNYDETSIENCEIGLVELYRNVARHAKSPIGRVEIVVDFDRDRFVLSVGSLGPPFQLEDAVAKYANLPPKQRTIHGLQNLLRRGSLHLSRDRGWNVMLFSTGLVSQPDDSAGATGIAFELHPAKVCIGNQSYAYAQWVSLLDEESKNLAQELETLVRKVAKSKGPLKIELFRREPNWTKSRLEIEAISLFDRCADLLKSIKNFQVSMKPKW